MIVYQASLLSPPQRPLFLVGMLGKRKESTLGMMGREKREALSVFPLLLFLLGYPAERPRFEKTIRATRKLGGGGKGECGSYYFGSWYCAVAWILQFSRARRARKLNRGQTREWWGIGRGTEDWESVFFFFFPSSIFCIMPFGDYTIHNTRKFPEMGNSICLRN